MHKQLTIDKLERKLDSLIPKYNVFNENHPMKGISYDKIKEKY